jgi:hypothetical protein
MSREVCVQGGMVIVWQSWDTGRFRRDVLTRFIWQQLDLSAGREGREGGRGSNEKFLGARHVRMQRIEVVAGHWERVRSSQTSGQVLEQPGWNHRAE